MAELAQGRTVYTAGTGRKTFLSLAFLLLLPFYVSLGPMLFSRFMHGLWFDTVGLVVFGLIFTALMLLLGVQLYHAVRSRIVLGETTARITVPAGSGALPMLRFVDKEVPYDQIQAIETRCVLFGNALAPVLLRATRLLTKDGQHIRLGTVNEDNVDPALPFPEIGVRLAERAGVAIADGGTVRRSVERRILGLIGRKSAPENSPPLAEAELSALKSRHKRALRNLVILATLLVATGIVIDFVNERTTYARAGTSAPAARR
jgi:hypothetical protein